MRRRSTGEDEMEREREREREREKSRGEEYVYVYALFCLCMDRNPFIRTYACAIGSQSTQRAQAKKNAPRNPFSLNIATVGDGY
jgi:hypothetical protein